MNANCLFLAMDEDSWRELRRDPETQLSIPDSLLLFAPAREGGMEFRGLELQDDIADALQFLLDEAVGASTGPTAPFVHALASVPPIHEAVGQPTPLDGAAWYLSPEEVRRAALGLARVSGQELASRYDPGAWEESGLARVSDDFDHLEPWKQEDLPALEEAYTALVEYFQQAAELRHGMLVLLEDGPSSSLDLDLG